MKLVVTTRTTFDIADTDKRIAADVRKAIKAGDREHLDELVQFLQDDIAADVTDAVINVALVKEDGEIVAELGIEACDICGETTDVQRRRYVLSGRVFTGPVCGTCSHCEDCQTELTVTEAGDVYCQTCEPVAEGGAL